MTFKSVFLAALLSMLGACAAPVERAVERAPVRSVQSEPDAPVMLNELARVAALSAEQRRRELAALEAERRLDDARRFQLAALLERDDSVEALERSLKTLGTMTSVDVRAQPLIDLMKRSLKARIELRQQSARAQELQDKLDQIKALEKSLQQRNAPAQTP
jgi:hypothetical protein